MFLFASVLIALAGTGASSAAAAVTAPATEVAAPNPKAMSQSEIRAFNAHLEKGHKHYIRCRRSAAIGSYVKREFSCRTNEQWAQAEANGNQEARDIGEEMKSKALNTSGD